MTNVICTLIECMYHNKRDEPGNRCIASAIGIEGRHQCDSYMVNATVDFWDELFHALRRKELAAKQEKEKDESRNE